ncbi:hypothetical protein DIURU_000358 [Diutina rugosa]|uniref:Ubiquitin-like protease family profile domain-containing protein n=1 Tax=Diutina rugosa TaxID=5481 RepID=A0A642UYG5_DIURU|nr:uncharacterized protein DIURU_000358 [Diutina rugosa]KAA8907948.1 hypothetical protein DIURU_000358 [Diutina rugosa]
MGIVYDPDADTFGFGTGHVLPHPQHATGLAELPWGSLVASPPSPLSPSVGDGETNSAATTTKSKRKRKQQSKRKAKTKAKPLTTEGNSGDSGGSESVVGKSYTQFTIKQIYSQIVGSTKASDKLFSYRTLPVYREDIDYILPGEWLNDSDISLAYEMMSALLQHHGMDKLVQMVWPSVVHLLMYSPMDPKDLLPPELDQAEVVFLPINVLEEDDADDDNDGDHWALTVLSVVDHVLYVYDSMSEEPLPPAFGQMAQKLLRCNLGLRTSKPLKVEVMKCDQQHNFDDCGIHVIINSALIVRQLIAAKTDDTEVDMDLGAVKADSFQARGQFLALIKQLQDQLEASASEEEDK